MRVKSTTGLCAVAIFVLCMNDPALAQTTPTSSTKNAMDTSNSLDSITLLALSVADGRAVLLMPDKKMLTLKVGDAVPSTQAVIKQVLADKLVLQENSATQGKQVIWLFTANTQGVSRIQRISSLAPATRYQAVEKVVGNADFSGQSLFTAKDKPAQ